MNFFSKSLTARIKEQVKDQLPQILPKEMSNFAPPVIEALIKESRDEVTLVKVSSQPHSTYEAASTLIEFELKKILLDKIEKNFFFSYDVYLLKRSRKNKDKYEDPSAGPDRGLKKRKLSKDAEPTTGLKKKDSTNGSSKGTKSQSKSSRKFVQSEEPVFEENPEGGDYPFDLSKCLPLITRGKCQRVPFGYFINNDLKYLQGGVSTMTYMTSTTKTKAAQYDLPGIWSPVKVAYDKYALWGISHYKEQRKSFYAYARGIQSRGDVYFTKRILAVPHVKVMKKHGYGYLEEIVVRRADNVLNRFKEGDDVADFAIALRMFTRSLVIQKRVEDLQLGVKSYQKQINVTKPDTIRQDLRKRHPYTPYKDPQGFILKDSFMLTNSRGTKYRHGVLAEEKMVHIIKEKSSFHDQGHQQAAKGKEDDEEFGKICWR
ncbi:hypothetical protein Tco_0299580 [Tanacetum coccineum]